MMYTGLFAAVIFTGTIYGAGLKTQQEWKTEKQKVQEASVDDKVAIMQQRRKDLERQKDEIEAKLDVLRARVKAKAEFEAGQGGQGAGGSDGSAGFRVLPYHPVLLCAQ
ncbi:hypothetical protein N0V88_003468 [Collariella sp. IMI 366227]|nr:hypothetical protein N0V88_003468 [Collariella sp. IMI 366227]